jgi:hypothetical protein
VRTSLLYTSFALFYGAVAAHAQTGPPAVIRIYVEQVKPGRNAAHIRAESAYARAFARGNYPNYYIGLDSMSGNNESWFVESHKSFAEVEKSEKAADAEPLKTELEQAAAADGEYLTATRSIIGLYRKDLSYDPEGSPSLSKWRYVNLVHIRIKMGMEQRLVSTVGELLKIYKNVSMPQAAIVYQMISGAPSGTFLIFEPVASLAEWDKYPAIMQSIRDTASRKFDAVEKDFAEIATFEEGRLMAINPRMSYVSKETIAGDPDFWSPKAAPKGTSKTAPKKAAPKQTGQ